MCVRVLLLLACLALCHGHAVVPVAPVVPAAHAYPGLLAPYPLLHHGYAGHGLLGHGYLAGPVGHHLWKRSPHYVAPLAHVAPVAAVAPVAIAPVAVSHQARLDVHSSPVLPIPLVHKALIAPLPYGGLHGHYPHVGQLGHY